MRFDLSFDECDVCDQKWFGITAEHYGMMSHICFNCIDKQKERL